MCQRGTTGDTVSSPRGMRLPSKHSSPRLGVAVKHEHHPAVTMGTGKPRRKEVI